MKLFLSNGKETEPSTSPFDGNLFKEGYTQTMTVGKHVAFVRVVIMKRKKKGEVLFTKVVRNAYKKNSRLISRNHSASPLQ